MLNSLINQAKIYESSLSSEQENYQAQLYRVLEFRKLCYPVLSELLDPQRSKHPLVQEYVKSQLNPKCSIDDFYADKDRKASVLAKLIDEIFESALEYGLEFAASPSTSDRAWTKQLLIYDLLYYGPVTLLFMERIISKFQTLSSNPVKAFIDKQVHGGLINEVRVNDFEQIYFEANNKVYDFEISFISNEHLQQVIERMISENNILNNSSININSSSPIVDFEHPCGFVRGAAVIPPASESPLVTLRVHPSSPYTLVDLQERGMLDYKIYDFLKACQQAGTTMAIAGTMGSGKTTLLSALSELWPADGRKATIEDTPELKPRLDDLVKLRTIEYDNDSIKDIDVFRLTKACKRHSVRYVALSEARDGAAWEILQLSQAILGSLMTFHYTLRSDREQANQALNTLVALCKQHPLAPNGDDIKHIIGSIVQVLVFVEQDPVDQVRRLTKVSVVNGFDEMNGGFFKVTDIYSYDRESDSFELKNKSEEFIEYLKQKGVDYNYAS